MELLTNWLGFLGAWLLFAGPIYQASLELQEQDIETDRIRATGAKIERPTPVSAWWWLIPPAKFILAQRRSREYRKQYIKALLSEDVQALMSYMDKSIAWLMVGAGGLLLAVKETYDLTNEQHWNTVIFWILTAVMTLISMLYTVIRQMRTNKVIAYNQKHTGANQV